MKQIQKQLSYSLAAIMVILGMAVVPVSADTGSGDTGSGAVTPSQTTPIEGENGSSPTGFRDPVPNSTDGAGSGASTTSQSQSVSETENDSKVPGSLHTEANQLLSQDRQNGKQHSAADRLKACEQRQTEIDSRTAQFATQAAKHLDTFNSIFTKLQAFHDSKGLNVSNYSTLVADATAKQTAAQSAVDALKALNVKIDCTQADPASTVATIKTAVSNARTALQDYRTSLKNLVVALKGASTAQSSTTQTTGGTQQ